ncbi:major facilitator superfamily domain-containing protein [Phycomyces nitens]|nr:major facilitator superfamily domain-containing protein [Phycomyces nitens]
MYGQEDPPTSTEERAFVRKLDFMIMPIICTIDFLQFLDKSTITYASGFGFKEKVNLVGNQFALLGSIFYLGYLVFQIPNNFLLQRVPLGKYIGVMVFMWGSILALTALGHNFSQIAAMRFLLGFFEAGIYPALTLLVSTFYRRSEQVTRLGAFWLCNGLGLIIGGVLTYGIGNMHNLMGLEEWQWIMIILGSLTAIVGLFSFFFLIDNPKSRALGLNAEQEILVEERTRDNAVVRTSLMKKSQILEALREPRFWCFSIACLFINLQNGAMTIYSSQITMGFGFTGLQSTLLSVGSGGSIIVLIVLSIVIVKKTRETIYSACFMMVINIIGLILLLVIPETRAKLFGFYLSWAYVGAYILMITSISNNVSGYTKKIFYNGLIMIFYTIGNFCGPLMMNEAHAPKYVASMIGYIIASTLSIILLLAARWRMAIVNRRRLENSSAILTNVEDDLSDVQDPNFIYRL